MATLADRKCSDNIMQFRNVLSLHLLGITIMILAGFLIGPVMATGSPGSWQVSTVPGDFRYYPFIPRIYD
jgi:hypothetical protein